MSSLASAALAPALVLLAACHSPASTLLRAPGAASAVACPAPPPGSHTIVVAGDVAEKGRTEHARSNAALVRAHTPPVEAIVLLGDNVRFGKMSGMTLLEYFQRYWAPPAEGNWGQFDGITYPQLGNHEYAESGAAGYYQYFGKRLEAVAALPSYHGEATVPGRGWYSFDLGAWHVLSIPTPCAKIEGGCAAGSPLETWVRQDLAAHATMPIFAVWHPPRFACGEGHGDATELQPLWADLVAAGADFVFAGHNHYYQRWNPLNAEGQPDPKGTAQIVVGSTGVEPYKACGLADPREASEASGQPGAGVFFMNLGDDGSYCWEYRLESDGSVFESRAGRSNHPSTVRP